MPLLRKLGVQPSQRPHRRLGLQRRLGVLQRPQPCRKLAQ